MKPVDRQKICPNCDGRVAYDATQCTYCFATLQVDNSTLKIFNSPAPQENLYTPPYSAKPSEPPKTAPIYAEKDISSLLNKTEVTDTKSFLPLLALILGGNLLTLAVLQFFFSDHGIVKLEINGTYWFLILLVALPLLYLGLKNSSKE